MSSHSTIETPHDSALDDLCQQLALAAGPLDVNPAWPAEQLALCGRYGVYRWFLPPQWGGLGWSDADIARGYLRLSAACLTTTFIITQRTGACQRIAASDNNAIKQRWLEPLASGRAFATVGISHLTTSRRHLARPVLHAEEIGEGFLLDGLSPWVTGSPWADLIVTGASLDDGQQILIAMPTDLPGVSAPEPPRLVGLSASCTGEVRCQQVRVAQELLLAGPSENVMRAGVGAGTGGLQTSTLAIGAAGASIQFLEHESQARPDLGNAATELRKEHGLLVGDLLGLAEGAANCSSENLRARANSLVLRSAQSALAAAKGTGYVIGHPAGRWCREALFFLVWSCPQPVLAANLCELAGIE